MKQLIRMMLLVGAATALTAQTLSFGEITLVTPVTTPPTYAVNLILTTSGTAAGAQFDLNFDPTKLNVTVGLGSSATAASKELSTVCLGQVLPGCSVPAANNPSTKAAMNNGPGWRAIIAGVSLADSQSGSVGPGGQTVIADGPVATLTVQATSAAVTTGQTLTLLNMMGTTAGNGQTAPAGITLTIGAGSSDPGATGQVDLSKIYQVGDVFPYTGATLGTFGNGLDINDAIQVLFAVDHFSGYPVPAPCTDRLDAMDSFPPDTPTARGGNQVIDINDAIETLFRVDNFSGYNIHPVRTSLGYNGVCPQKTTANIRTLDREPISRPAVRATLVLGPAEPSGNGQRVPVYLNAVADLSRLAFTFGLGDEQSQLHFQAAPGLTPSLVVDSVRGVVAAAWFGGVDVAAGQRPLLGYVVGPSGFASNLKVFGISAATLNDRALVGLDVSGAPLAQ